MPPNDNHYTGTASEYFVAAHYLSRGFDVWWPSNQHSRSDFAISRGRDFKKVQVKTVSWNRREDRNENEYLAVSLSGSGGHYRNGDFDVLALYEPVEQALWLIPWDEVPGRSVALGTRGPTARPRCSTYDPDKWRVK